MKSVCMFNRKNERHFNKESQWAAFQRHQHNDGDTFNPV